MSVSVSSCVFYINPFLLIGVFQKKKKRVLYTGNVGDARAVLCHGNRAIRLSYDHKGSDHTEAQRILDVGGFVMNNRVNGKTIVLLLFIVSLLFDW